MADQWQYPKETPYKIPGRGWLQAGEMFQAIGGGAEDISSAILAKRQLEEEQKQQDFLNKLKIAGEERDIEIHDALIRKHQYEESLRLTPPEIKAGKERDIIDWELNKKQREANLYKTQLQTKQLKEQNPAWDAVNKVIEGVKEYDTDKGRMVIEGLISAASRGDMASVEYYGGLIPTIPTKTKKHTIKYGAEKDPETGEPIIKSEDLIDVTANDPATARRLYLAIKQNIGQLGISGEGEVVPEGRGGLGLESQNIPPFFMEIMKNAAQRGVSAEDFGKMWTR